MTFKKAKDRITVALCCSSDGSEKMKPYVIRKALKPRCFRNFNVNLYADYTANKKASVTRVGVHHCQYNQQGAVNVVYDNVP
jgi:hypothetical protein